MRVVVDNGCFPTGRHYPGIAHLLRIVAAGLADEFTSDHLVHALPLVCIDTETTGTDPANDRVVEVACVVWKDGQIAASKSWLVNPGRPIPKEAFDIHGIGDEQVASAPSFPEIVSELCEMLRGHVPVAYNAEFDRKMLMAELGRLPQQPASLPAALRKGIEWIDPLVWARELHKLEKSRALGDVAQRLGIELENAHRAEFDAEATLKVFAAFCGDVRVPKTYGALIQEQRRLDRLFDVERARWRN
jgi:DNA polymerase-3 subunit epsilon